ncbi:hypothetical protein SUGI_0141580 [Cryptomeria japonica]|uniref:uncharacterized protein LOC131032592 n=1 Tax=Cryptomeria japonica TaxID=3369 RepID=UPI002408F11A|nr:uncharacterized protein LOC131032592 [Cryptomeria japonica]GLJ11054.1 hypothetical protein SUGI_0141580 [Cryptomeria japonica]
MMTAIHLRNTGMGSVVPSPKYVRNNAMPRLNILAMARKRIQTRQVQSKAKRDNGKQPREENEKWSCVSGCGACCKLAKGPSFAPPEDIFMDVDDIVLYWSMTGPDGWCVNYDKINRTCSIYSERPYFCRVEPDVFKKLYGINEKNFNKEACGSCRDTIKNVYGSISSELENFNKAITKTRTN